MLSLFERSSRPDHILSVVTQFSADLLKKPHAYICVSYTHNEYLAWEGTFEPAFLLTIVRVLPSCFIIAHRVAPDSPLSARRAWTTSARPRTRSTASSCSSSSRRSSGPRATGVTCALLLPPLTRRID